MFSAVLDACALYPASVRDTLLRLGESEIYVPLWSHRILDEVRRNLLVNGIDTRKADRMLEFMQDSFPEAVVDAREIDRLELVMTNDPKDRHVLAAAVAADSELVVTFNIGDFPPDACEDVGVEAMHPDAFLLDLYDLDPDVVAAVVRQQAADLVNPPITPNELLGTLERAGLVEFAAAVRDEI